jgi:GT2 family glycosyltransferase
MMPPRAASSPALLRISVVIVNWNASADLAECLESLRAQTSPAAQVIVVDNGSTDGSAEMVRRRFPEVHLLEPGANLGFAQACNLGIEAATGEWIAILNNDAVAEPAWLAELEAAVHRGGPELGSLQSRVLFKQKPDRTNSTGIVLFRNGHARDRDFDVLARPEDHEEPIFCPTASAALYRRAMLDELRLPSGYFDGGFFMYMEDVDLGWRARLAGWESLYVPTSIVKHVFQGSSAKRGSSFVELQCDKNRLRTILKNASIPFLLRNIPRTLFDIGRIFYRGGTRVLPDLVSGAVDALKQRPVVSRLDRAGRRAIERRWTS